MYLLQVRLPLETLGQRVLFSIPFLAIALIFFYEWIAVLTQWSPSLSKIMAYVLTSRGPGWAFVYGAVAGVSGVILFLHFVGLLKWWQPT